MQGQAWSFHRGLFDCNVVGAYLAGEEAIEALAMEVALETGQQAHPHVSQAQVLLLPPL